ncbi:MAG TPA: hypothetical protein VG477_17705, partial [Thermoanaerobaculia bacterium]|nr:hypothetical protein [Thermoanaerobaculia bacterium]
MSSRRFAVVLLGLLFALPLAALGQTLGFVDEGGRPATAFAAGERVYLRLEAPQQNTDPSTREVAMATLVAGNDREDVYLSETGPDTGFFEGAIASEWTGSSHNNNTLEVFPPGQTMTATYDAGGGATVQATATLAESRADFVDAQGAPAEFYLETTQAYVRVVYQHYAFSFLNVDTVTATITTVNAADSETLTLTETGPDTGVFTGSIPFNRALAAQENGYVETQEAGPPYEFDTLSLTFQGASATSTDSVPTLGSLTMFLDAYGNEVTAYPAGSTLHMRVEDHNFNDPFRIDSVSATVQSLSTQDAETVTLFEVNKNSGVFEGSLPSQVGASPLPSNNRLEVNAVETIEAMHVDANGVLASGAQAQVRFAKIEFIDEAGRPTAQALMNGMARLRVLSLNDNADSSRRDSLTVEVRSRYAADLETVVLTETGADTGVFEGSIRVQNGAGA